MARKRAERAGLDWGAKAESTEVEPGVAGASAQGLLVDEGGLERVLVQLVKQGEAGGEARVVRRQGANEGHGDKLLVQIVNGERVWAQIAHLTMAASTLVIRDDRDSFSSMWMAKNSSQALKRMPGFFCRCTVSSFVQILQGSSEMFSRCVFWSSEMCWKSSPAALSALSSHFS